MKDPPINLTSYTRNMNKYLLEKQQKRNKGKNKNPKANIWLCGNKSNFTNEYSEKTNCAKCGIECYYTNVNVDLIHKKHIKICCSCGLKYYRNDMPNEIIKILESIK